MGKKRQAPSSSHDVLKVATPAQMSVEQALSVAARQIDSGQLAAAETLLRKILLTQPQHAFALHLLGVLAYRTGHGEQALDLIGRAIEILPTVAQFHSNRGEMCRQLGRLSDAIAHGEQAVRLDSRLAAAHSNLGIAYLDRKDYARAEACQILALDIDPSLHQARINLGNIRRVFKDRARAASYFRQVLAAVPGHLEARNNLGAVLAEMEQPEEAIAELLRVIRARPDYADAHCNLGNALLLAEQFNEAQQAFQQTLARNPGAISAFLGLARVGKELNRLGEARSAVNSALACDPESAEAHCLLGDILIKMDDYDEAKLAYDRTLSIDKNSVRAYLGKGDLHLEMGQLEEAKSSYMQAIEIDRLELEPWEHLALAIKVQPGDECLKRLESEAEQISAMPDAKAMNLHFALAKAYDDVNAFDKAFSHFQQGCRLKRARLQYDADNFDRACENIRSIFSKETVDQLRGGGDQSELPIFVLGMPRSGTTLVETILASHPVVYAAGELSDLLALANQPRVAEASRGFPLSMQGLSQDDLTQMGHRYIAGLRTRSSSALHITDKMQANFLALGLIHLMLPRAKIIHVKRDAADTCLSNFTRMFSNRQNFSYDLSELGRYYANYARLMDHWRQVLPDGSFCEVQYEELVAGKETQIRHLIDYCGLEWDDACLDPHKSGRSFKTAGISQVRPPVCTSSVGRWRNYETYLQPLIAALGEYAPDTVAR